MNPEPSHPVGQPKRPNEIPGPIQPARNRDRQPRRNARRPGRERRERPPEQADIPPEDDQTDAAEAGDEHVVDYLA